MTVPISHMHIVTEMTVTINFVSYTIIAVYYNQFVSIKIKNFSYESIVPPKDYSRDELLNFGICILQANGVKLK